MRGTEKQIQWAERIRGLKILHHRTFRGRLSKATAALYDIAIGPKYETCDDATWWIENRDVEPQEMYSEWVCRHLISGEGEWLSNNAEVLLRAIAAKYKDAVEQIVKGRTAAMAEKDAARCKEEEALRNKLHAASDAVRRLTDVLHKVQTFLDERNRKTRKRQPDLPVTESERLLVEICAALERADRAC